MSFGLTRNIGRSSCGSLVFETWNPPEWGPGRHSCGADLENRFLASFSFFLSFFCFCFFFCLLFFWSVLLISSSLYLCLLILLFICSIICIVIIVITSLITILLFVGVVLPLLVLQYVVRLSPQFSLAPPARTSAGKCVPPFPCCLD